MKDFDWTGKMMPGEYAKMCDYCRKTGLEQIDKEKEMIDGDKYFAGIYDYAYKNDKMYIGISSISQCSVDCKKKWLYVQATLQWTNRLPTGLCDCIEIRKNISTTGELAAFLGNASKLQNISENFNLYQL